jgi:hypothetical protein
VLLALSFCSSPAGGGDNYTPPPGDNNNNNNNGSPNETVLYTVSVNAASLGSNLIIEVTNLQNRITIPFPDTARSQSYLFSIIGDKSRLDSAKAFNIYITSSNGSNKIDLTDSAAIQAAFIAMLDAAPPVAHSYGVHVKPTEGFTIVSSYSDAVLTNISIGANNTKADASRTGNTVSMTVAWKNDSGAFSIPSELDNMIASGDTVNVTFRQADSGTNRDRISFGRVSELRTALIAAGAATVNMSSSDDPGKSVAPLFNADEIFSWPGTSTDKVFNKYTTNGEKIFGNIKVYNASSNQWYIDVPSGQKIIITKLNLMAYPSASNNTYLNGFGLKVANKNDITFDNTILTGLNQPSSNAQVAPSKLDAAFALLKLDSKADFPVFNGITNSGIYLDKIGIEDNIAASARVEAFLTKTIESSTIANLEKLVAVDNSLIFQKSNPYSVNSYSTANPVNGNLAVWLGSKGVEFSEVYLTNPSLYALNSTNMIGRVRNAVLDGNDWSKITLNNGAGVIVSKNTPVAGIPSSTNLWYVVQGQSSTHTAIANISVLELTSGVTDASKISAPGASHNLAALITTGSSQRNQVDSRFHPASGKDYVGTRPSTTNWQTYAAGVIGNSPPAITKADKLEAYGEWLRNGPELFGNAGVSVTFFLDKFLFESLV